MKKALFMVALAIGMTSPAGAAIISGTSDAANGFVKIANPAGLTLGNNSIQSNTLFGFDEAQGVTLTANLNVGNNNPVNRLLAGTKVNSHLIFFDPARNTLIRGALAFNGTVLAVIISDARLAATDALFGLRSVRYLTPNNRGLESNDRTFVSQNLFDVRLNAGNPGDFIRVLTAVPEPASWAMMLAGFGLIGGTLRRNRRTKMLPA